MKWTNKKISIFDIYLIDKYWLPKKKKKSKISEFVTKNIPLKKIQRIYLI